MGGPSPPGEDRLHVLVSGASGFIGSALVRQLSLEGYRISRLVRRAAGPGEISWDPAEGYLDSSDIEGVDALVHLAGENIAARWTKARKARIRDSRVRGTRLLSEALAGARRPPAVLVSASAIGIYGDRGDEILTEKSPPADPRQVYLAAVARQWEEAAEPARIAGIRVVHPRFGVVLSPQGGALHKMLPAFRLGLGGAFGDGRQWMSWISLEDTVGAIRHALLTETLVGPVNVTAPEPVTNRTFTGTLGRVLSRPTLIPLPAAVLRVALGEMGGATLLASTRAIPERLQESGYRFTATDLEVALRKLLTDNKKA